MTDYSEIIAESEVQAARILAIALQRTFCTARDWNEREAYIRGAHQLLECAAMLRALSPSPLDQPQPARGG